MNDSSVIQVPQHIHSTELRTSTFPPGSKFTMTIDALKFLRHKLFSKNTSSVTSANKHGSLFPGKQNFALLCVHSQLSCTLRQFATKYGQKKNTNERIIQNYLAFNTSHISLPQFRLQFAKTIIKRDNTCFEAGDLSKPILFFPHVSQR